MKKTRFILFLFLIFLCSCGGGSTSGGEAANTVSGSVQASYINGVRICVDDTVGTQNENCATTSRQGNFTLNNATGKNLALLIDTVRIGTIPDTQVVNGITITPALLSQGEATKARNITALFHQAGKALEGETYDLSNMKKTDINENDMNAFLAGTKDNLTVGEKIGNASKEHLGAVVSLNVKTTSGQAPLHVSFEVQASILPAEGYIYALECDFSGNGSYTTLISTTAHSSALNYSSEHIYDSPGQYGMTCLTIDGKMNVINSATYMVTVQPQTSL